jgi:branched-chain amino acid aminotransferase
MNRLRNSCERISLPDFSGDELIKLIKNLVKIDKRFVPETEGHSLYIRPTAIANN